MKREEMPPEIEKNSYLDLIWNQPKTEKRIITALLILAPIIVVGLTQWFQRH